MKVGEQALLPDQQPAVTILRSKLYRPPVATDLVEREWLQARLEAGRRRPLTLVSAPAGYGKTTLVSHWLETCGLPAAWLSLDETDGDTAVFLQYFAAAVRTLFADACRDSLTLAGAPELPPAPVLAGCLSNDLDAIGEPLVLVLDDYHRVATDRLREPSVHELLDQLLRRPPRGLHLTIVSRRDPPLSLVSLRGRHLMTEIRMRDLQFTTQESATFLERAVGRPLDRTGLKRLQESTEGWPVALRLAALALPNDGSVDELARGITGDSWQLREYLVAEVLSRQTPAVRDWLYKTSILERLCAPLVEAVCGSEDVSLAPVPGDSSAPVPGDRQGGAALGGREFIRILESRGLFCVALDARGEWYRYHHLFREVLQSGLAERFDHEEIAALHARAAVWLESHGLAVEQAERALAGAIHNRRFLIETLALKALARDAQGDESAALELLGRAVSLAQPGRWIRPFVDLGPGLAGLLHRLDVAGDALRYVGEIRAAFHTESRSMRPTLRAEEESGEPPETPAGSQPGEPQPGAPQPGAPQPLPEPLTPRELEILDLLAQRLSNREIADRLFISSGTVKRHNHNIYGKLGASGRREVVTKALGLGILGNR